MDLIKEYRSALLAFIRAGYKIRKVKSEYEKKNPNSELTEYGTNTLAGLRPDRLDNVILAAENLLGKTSNP
jgi:hypothetical protein